MNALSLPVNLYVNMEKVGRIIRIGNSHGVIIPSALMKELSWNTEDEVKLTMHNGSITVKKVEPYSGPYTGIFADMPRPEPGEPDPWGETDDLRTGRYNRPKNLDW